ncbi:GntR family transcriptional regulator [Paenibacillus doosanensis]|uniref:HTH-type transcriptional regulator YurK n=1 Tax=Paenibacillus konkukensis TaxID=2020716 RepID=A0ABY4RFY6_9BACL|nr:MULTISPECIES: GntR family transcriptional regulator [Paenibacillus]MCS7460582.1 GntR family transcriptional regulator [Paenibacillus doosanensis]UQZ81197.1 putative HTH-type transcriptional regulator YurK [Paenibacillus konkukensis]
MYKLEQDNVVPMYVQLMQIIKDEIAAGKLKPGQKLPTELELCEMYSISRRTVRSAINELIEEGLLTRKQGKGTFIHSNKIERELGPALGFSEICRLNGLTATSEVIEQKRMNANQTLAAAMGVPANTVVASIKRVMMADGVPVMLDYTVLPPEYISLLDEELANKSLYATLRDQFNVVLTRNRKSIQIVFADAFQAKHLQVKKGYPLLMIQGAVYSPDMKVVHYGDQYIVGDKIKFYI